MRLDLRAAAYASTHSVSELRRWCKRFIVRTEGEEFIERANKAREARNIDISYGDDGMAAITGIIPTPAAAAIEAKLNHGAANLNCPDETTGRDDRTKAQKKADLFVAWLTHGDRSDVCGVRTDIAVTFTPGALSGTEPAIMGSYDGHWFAPLGWLNQLMDPDTGHLWHRIITTPTGDVLDHTFLGRFFPALLSKALEYRDQICQAPGCTTPARNCDLDHRIPHPRGPTTADNGQHLCRKHHKLKSHGQLITFLDGNTYTVHRPTQAERNLNNRLWG